MRCQGDANNNNWIRVELPMDSTQKFSIEFVAMIGTGEKGDMVLDDISFSRGCTVGGRLNGLTVLLDLRSYLKFLQQACHQVVFVLLALSCQVTLSLCSH